MGSGKAMTKGTPHSADHILNSVGYSSRGSEDIFNRISSDLIGDTVPMHIKELLRNTTKQTNADFKAGLINHATVRSKLQQLPLNVAYAGSQTYWSSLEIENLKNPNVLERRFSTKEKANSDVTDLKLVNDSIDGIVIAQNMTKGLKLSKIPVMIEFNSTANAKINGRPEIPLASFSYYPNGEMPPILQVFMNQKEIQSQKSQRGVDYTKEYKGDNYEFFNVISRSSYAGQYLVTQNIKQAVFHEYGHFVYHSLSGNLGKYNISRDKKIMEAMTVFESNTHDLMGISMYGSTDKHEAFAEAFANYMRGNLYVPFDGMGNAYYREFLVLMNKLNISLPGLIKSTQKNTKGGTSPYADDLAKQITHHFKNGDGTLDLLVHVPQFVTKRTLSITKEDYIRRYKYVKMFGQYRKYNTRTGRLISVSLTEPEGFEP